MARLALVDAALLPVVTDWKGWPSGDLAAQRDARRPCRGPRTQARRRRISQNLRSARGFDRPTESTIGPDLMLNSFEI